MGRYSWRAFLRCCRAHRITAFFTVPAIWARIAKSPDVSDHFDSFVGGHGGAAPMDAELANAAMARVGKGAVQLGGTYGMSETTGSVLTLPRGMPDRTGSVGTVHPNAMIRVVGDSGEDVEDGQPGELLVKGPTVTKGYHGDEAATRAAFLDGWYRSGDIVQRGANDLWYVVDRKKELIKYKGLQVAPAELEGILLADPRVKDAAVIGVPFEGTEAPRGYVVRAEGAGAEEISDEDVRGIVRGKVAAYKELRGGVVFVDEIPRSAVGKILRRELRERAKWEGAARL